MVEVGQVWASKIDELFQIEIIDLSPIHGVYKIEFPSGATCEATYTQITRKYNYIGRKEEGYNPIEEIKNLYK